MKILFKQRNKENNNAVHQDVKKRKCKIIFALHRNHQVIVVVHCCPLKMAVCVRRFSLIYYTSKSLQYCLSPTVMITTANVRTAPPAPAHSAGTKNFCFAVLAQTMF